MEEQLVHCARCDKEVRIVVTSEPHDGQANVRDPEVVCLDFGEGCTESACPVCGVAGIVMGVRLARSNLRPERSSTVRASCQGCSRTVDLEIIDRHYAYCPDCGTTNRWAMLHHADEYVVVTRGP